MMLVEDGCSRGLISPKETITAMPISYMVRILVVRGVLNSTTTTRSDKVYGKCDTYENEGDGKRECEDQTQFMVMSRSG
jgi:hypothetical protein